MEFTDFSKTSFYYPSSQSVWDFGDLAAAERHSLGFMELLSSQQHQDFATVSPHSFLLQTSQPQTQTQPSAKLSSSIIQAPPSEQLVTSKVESLCSDHLLINPPATPNSSSISSASTDALASAHLSSVASSPSRMQNCCFVMLLSPPQKPQSPQLLFNAEECSGHDGRMRWSADTAACHQQMARDRKRTRAFVCSDCGTCETPERRSGPQGPRTLCNKCGLRYKRDKSRIEDVRRRMSIASLLADGNGGPKSANVA